MPIVYLVLVQAEIIFITPVESLKNTVVWKVEKVENCRWLVFFC